MTREELLKGIEEISALLKGPEPLSNFERRMYHEDRKDLRAALAELDAKEESANE